jgi:hypothetical protein
VELLWKNPTATAALTELSFVLPLGLAFLVIGLVLPSLLESIVLMAMFCGASNTCECTSTKPLCEVTTAPDPTAAVALLVWSA